MRSCVGLVRFLICVGCLMLSFRIFCCRFGVFSVIFFVFCGMVSCVVRILLLVFRVGWYLLLFCLMRWSVLVVSCVRCLSRLLLG